MHRCELDDNGTQKGFVKFYYDGQDFIILNLTNGNWTAANDRAERFLKNWESAITESNHWKRHLNTCIEWLRLLLERKGKVCHLIFITVTAHAYTHMQKQHRPV